MLRIDIFVYICQTNEQTNTDMTTQRKLYWVLGDHINGFKIVDKRPRTKHVPEPHESLEAAKRWTAMQFLLNA